MAKKKTIIKWSLIVLAGLIVSAVSFGYWFLSLLPPPAVSKEEMQRTVSSDLPYLTEDVIPNRGKILAIVTSTSTMGSSEKTTGYELHRVSKSLLCISGEWL